MMSEKEFQRMYAATLYALRLLPPDQQAREYLADAIMALRQSVFWDWPTAIDALDERQLQLVIVAHAKVALANEGE